MQTFTWELCEYLCSEFGTDLILFKLTKKAMLDINDIRWLEDLLKSFIWDGTLKLMICATLPICLEVVPEPGASLIQ